ncbi:MAG: thiamine pyrophosphate-binding protein [Lautropia sp.]
MNDERLARGADALVDAITATGARRVFTLSGNHIMPVFDATIGSDLQLVHTRHEAAAVHMADAWARLSGEVGVALVTGGPGHANAVSALYTAAMSDSPVVLLSGHAPLAQLGNGAFQEMRQAELAAPVAKASWTCERADAVADDFARAVAIARSGRPGPVHLSLPSDVLEARAGTATARAHAAASSSAPALPAARETTPHDARRLLARLRAAKRPLILAGPFASRGADRDAARALAGACGIPVVAMQSPRGVADPALGAFAQVLARADCILLVGKRVDFTLRFGDAPAIDAQCTFMQIEPDALERTRAQRLLGARLEIQVDADACGALASLAAVSDAPSIAGDWRDTVEAAVAWRPPAWASAAAGAASRVHPAAACRALQALLDSHPDSVLVCDGGEFGQWAQACLNAPNLVFNGPAGAIGVGVPFAIAASLARPGAPVVAAMGDGSIGFHIAEFDTAVRCGARFVALVGNDARWNAEYQIQLNAYGARRTIGCELAPTRYDAVASAFGAFGARVDDPGQLAAAIGEACASGRAACINVMIEGLAAPVIRMP